MIGGKYKAGRYDVILRNHLSDEVAYKWIQLDNGPTPLWADKKLFRQWKDKGTPFSTKAGASIVLGSDDMAKIPTIIAAERQRYLDEFGVVPDTAVRIMLREEHEWSILLRVVFS